MLFLFNPPAPHADPISPHLPDWLGNNCCDRCISVPRYWQVSFPPLDLSHVGEPGFDLTQLMFAQNFALNRNLAILQTDSLCQWDCPVDVSDYYGPPGPTGDWRFYFSSDGEGRGGWTAIAETHDAGGPGFEFLAVYRLISGIPFDCLGPNVLNFLPPPDSGAVVGAPSTITLTPFWP